MRSVAFLVSELDHVYKKKMTIRHAYWSDVGIEESYKKTIKGLEAEESELYDKLALVLKTTIPDNAPEKRKEWYLEYVEGFGTWTYETWSESQDELEWMAKQEEAV